MGQLAPSRSLEAIQYIGLSRKVAASVKLHAFELPQQCASVRCAAVPAAAKADLQLAWKQWMVEHLAAGGAGGLPPGNVQGNTLWWGCIPYKSLLNAVGP
jgi:hypothetical protein